MEIDETIQTLAGIRRALDTWIPQATTRPDAADTDDIRLPRASRV
jgi:hypothetical protein